MRSIPLLLPMIFGLHPAWSAPPVVPAIPSSPTKGMAPTRNRAKPTVSTPAIEAPVSGDEFVGHLLNRFGFGPRPGDVARVRDMGWERWLEGQLGPDPPADLSVEAKLSGYSLNRLDPREYALREVALRKGVNVANRRQAQQREQTAAMSSSSAGAASTRPRVPVELSEAERRDLEASQTARRELTEASRQLVTEKFVRAVESENQIREVLVDFWSNHFNVDIAKTRSVKIADEHQVVRAHAMGRFADLLKASAHSPAMLVYLDNFQSVAPAPAVQTGLPARQMPANWEAVLRMARRGLPLPTQMKERVETIARDTSTPPEVVYDRIVRSMGPGNRDNRGLNENYARELLELHTLGVDGGYTQKDVQEVARCLTGWTVTGGRYGGDFQFVPRLHDNGVKVVLGKTIEAGGGVSDGEQVLELLARHPATMRHVSRKLCVRFVSDSPPTSLVDRCVAVWDLTDGDIRAIVRTIAHSPEFASRSAVRSKVKSPFEYAVSAVRALGGSVVERAGTGIPLRPNNNPGAPTSLEGQVGLMGQPLFRYSFPTGWPEESSKWVSSGALISRINFALALTSGQLRDVALSGLATDLGTDKSNTEWIDALAAQILGGSVGSSTKDTVVRQLGLDASAPAEPDVLSPRLTALLLGSPEFQRR